MDYIEVIVTLVGAGIAYLAYRLNKVEDKVDDVSIRLARVEGKLDIAAKAAS